MHEQTLLGGAIVLRPFRGEDVDAVNQLFKAAYGPQYPYKMSPDVPAGTYCYVAVARETNQVVGFARTRWLTAEHVTDAYPLVHELGGYVVAPSHRKHGIGNALSLLCERVAQTAQGDMHIAYSEPVCWGNGLASQQIFARHGFRVCGISALKYPEISPDHHGAQPASMILVARRNRASEESLPFDAYARYLPPDYEALVRELLGSTTTQVNEIDLTHLTFPPVIFHEPVATTDDIGAEIADIPANWPRATSIITRLRTEGWLFSGFLPEHGAITTPGGRHQRFDYLRLYRPPHRYRTQCDWDLLGTHDPMATRVKQFLREEHACYALTL